MYSFVIAYRMCLRRFYRPHRFEFTHSRRKPAENLKFKDAYYLCMHNKYDVCIHIIMYYKVPVLAILYQTGTKHDFDGLNSPNDVYTDWTVSSLDVQHAAMIRISRAGCGFY